MRPLTLPERHYRGVSMLGIGASAPVRKAAHILALLILGVFALGAPEAGAKGKKGGGSSSSSSSHSSSGKSHADEKEGGGIQVNIRSNGSSSSSSQSGTSNSFAP